MKRAPEDPKIKETRAFGGGGGALLQTVIIKVLFYKCLRQGRQALSQDSASEAHAWRGNGTRRGHELNHCCSFNKHSRAGVFLGSLRGKEGSGESHAAATLNS